MESNNKVKESAKRNSLGIGTAIATVLTWTSTTFFGLIIPPEVATAMVGIILMLISEFKS